MRSGILYKNRTEYAVVSKKYQRPMDMSKMKNSAEANSAFGLNAAAKVVFSKMLYRCELGTKIGSQDSDRRSEK